MGSHHRLAGAGLILLLCCAVPAWAGLADVLGARIERAPDGSYRIAATVRHADSGWDHYADRWEVLGPRGQVIATRVLLHPHVHEQPFTRGLSHVHIPATWTWVKIRAHDRVHGYGGREVTLSVPPSEMR
jgi:hypothetical protein